MRQGNPAINKLFANNSDNVIEAASYKGIALKTTYFLTLTLISALLAAYFVGDLISTNASIISTLLLVSSIGALISGLLAYRFSTMFFGSIYVILEGLLVGCISYLFEAVYQGVVLGALLSTIVVLAVMTLLNTTGILKVGNKFRRFITVAMISAVVTQLLFLVLSLFIPSISAAYYGNFWIMFGVSMLLVCLASFNVLIDIDNINKLVQNRMDKKYESHAAFGLVVSLIWLYIEFLRLFAILASNRTNN